MKSRTLARLAGSAVLASSVVGTWAEVKDNPYQVIVTRNAFALKPPPPPPPPGADQPPPSPVDVLLTGISTLGGTKKVLLQITDKSPSKAGKTEFPPPLVEGDVQGRIEVVSIDPDKGVVVIKIDGSEKTLTFDREPPKAGGPPPPGQPLPPGSRPGMPMPMPGAMPSPMGSIPAPATAPASSTGRYGVVVGGGSPTATPAPSVPQIPGMPAMPASVPGSVTVGGAVPQTAPSTTTPAFRSYRPTTGAGGVGVGGAVGTVPPPAIPPMPQMPR